MRVRFFIFGTIYFVTCQCFGLFGSGGYTEPSIYRCTSNSSVAFEFVVGLGERVQLTENKQVLCESYGRVTRMDSKHCYASANMNVGCRLPIHSLNWEGCFFPRKYFNMNAKLSDNSTLSLLCSRIKKGGDYDMDGSPH